MQLAARRVAQPTTRPYPDAHNGGIIALRKRASLQKLAVWYALSFLPRSERCEWARWVDCGRSAWQSDDMDSDWLFLGVCALLSGYGAWAIRRDLSRGRASARGLSFDQGTQPKRFRALMTFNCLAVALVWLGTAIEAMIMFWRLLPG